MGNIISVLGCGWLGWPLALEFNRLGYCVRGSTTSIQKIPQLEKDNIDPFLIQCSPNIVGQNLTQFFSCHILFINIPFKRNLEDPQFYYSQIQSLIPWIQKGKINQVIFAGSTSIYPESSGLICEDDPLIPDSDRSQVLWNIEKLLRGNKSFQTTILRLAGLYGPDREIGNFIRDSKKLDGAKPVNLIHRDDCVNIIGEIVKQKMFGEVFNLCSDEHPLRKDIYTQAAIRRAVPLPEFEKSARVNYKIVSNQKIKKRLKYQFHYPDPLAFLLKE
ncbi:MAG: SDR family NAD(P)-dependent oxidoreductase [Candidatus Omnitrophica bacterium]|nr:SDR family NAD(P)-dependent oxidoreductase [Candidatus Omnitrophota bacterium]